MYVQDLYAILHAHWVDDTKALHGRLQAELPLLLLLSGATTTRPGALVESNSAQGSNKVLSYDQITVMNVRNVINPTCSIIVVKVELLIYHENQSFLLTYHKLWNLLLTCAGPAIIPTTQCHHSVFQFLKNACSVKSITSPCTEYHHGRKVAES